MTQQEVIDLINKWIVTNGNNEITAEVLNPVLQALSEQPNELIGDLEQLNTVAQDNLVNAINEILTEITSNSGIKLHSGIDDPNDVPPLTYDIADFYIENDILGNPQVLWQYNGIEWFNTSEPAPTTLEDARQNGATIDGNIDVSLQIENKQSTNLAQVVDVTGKTVSFSDSDTLTANFPVNYFENDSVDIETFTLPVIIGNEDKFIFFVNKSDELCTLTSDGINEIWYREELLSIQIQPKGSIILKNNGSYWVVLSLFQSLEEAREINNIVKGRIIGESVFTSKTSEDFAQIGDVNTAVSTKAPINNPTFTGSVVVPNATNNNEAVAFGQVQESMKLHRVYVENNLSETIQTTGTAGVVVFHTITFPANYFPENCVVEATISLSAVGTNGLKSFSAGFTLSAVTFPFHYINVPAINQQARATRTFVIKNGKMSSNGNSGSFYHDYLVFNYAPPNASFNVENSHNFIIRMENMNASDLIKLESLIIKVYKP